MKALKRDKMNKIGTCQIFAKDENYLLSVDFWSVSIFLQKTQPLKTCGGRGLFCIQCLNKCRLSI